MIYLSNTQSVVATVTLYEGCGNLVNPYFTWKIKNYDTLEETIFYQDDSSPSPYYYNSFTLSVATYSGLTVGIINVLPGNYEYEIYEMTNRYDLDIRNAVGLVESGLLNVESNSTLPASFTQSDYDIYRAFES